jgi:pimeloyl-ACP methyl ester carboxylesterase
MMALQWADLFPNELASIILINTSDGRLSSPHERLNLKNYRKILKALRHMRDPISFELNLIEMIAQNLKNKEEVAKTFAKATPTTLANLTRQLMAASTFRLPKKRPDVPALILAGREDAFVNPVCTKRIAKEFDLPVEWHPTAGHDIPLENPDWVNEKIFRFIDGLKI